MGRFRAVFVLIGLAGCVGAVESPADRREVPTGVGPAPRGRLGSDPLPARLWRLTPAEYVRTARALLGPAVVPSDETHDAFPRDPVVNGFDNGSATSLVGTAYADEVFALAERYAEAARGSFDDILPCNLGSNEAVCVDESVRSLATSAFRREPTDEELATLGSLYESGRDPGPEDGMVLVVQALLLSPQLLYRSELGAGSGASRHLRPWEAASALSYLVTGSPPDEALLADAAALVESADLREQHVRRLAGEAGPQLVEFVLEWMDIADVAQASKSADVYPAFSPDLADQMLNETERFVVGHWVEGAGTLHALFTERSSWVEPELAALYGVPHSAGPSPQAVMLPPERSGILTQASLLTAHARHEASSPVRRGTFAYRHLLCRDLPDPPPDVPMDVGVTPVGTTTREITAAHSADPACRACHQFIDPIGFGFEHFDGIGRYRDTESGLPVDASGWLPGGEAFTGTEELSGLLASHPDVEACFAERLAHYGLGVAVGDPETSEWVADALAAFRETDGRIVELIVALVRSDRFVERVTEEENP